MEEHFIKDGEGNIKLTKAVVGALKIFGRIPWEATFEHFFNIYYKADKNNYLLLKFSE